MHCHHLNAMIKNSFDVEESARIKVSFIYAEAAWMEVYLELEGEVIFIRQYKLWKMFMKMSFIDVKFCQFNLF